MDANLHTAVIRKCREKDKDDRPAGEQKWCLYTKDGKKLLGRHPSEEKAKKQEQAIQIRKHGSATRVRYRGAQYRLVSGQEAEELVRSIVKQQRTPAPAAPAAPVKKRAPSPNMFTREQATAMWLYGLEKALDKLYSLMVDSKGNKVCADSSQAEAAQKTIDTYMTSLLNAYKQYK